MSDPVMIGVFKAPDDPEEKKAWAHHMMRIQVAMWVDGEAACELCKKPYASVDDFLARNPKRGYGKEMNFVDSACWKAYATARKGGGP